jgi:hypothetical protein
MHISPFNRTSGVNPSNLAYPPETGVTDSLSSVKAGRARQILLPDKVASIQL